MTMFRNIKHHPILHRCDFDIYDLGVGIVNSIRRTILSEIPNIAVSFDPYNKDMNDTEFLINTSSLHNEFLGHRLSLIPICLSAEEIDSFNRDNYLFEIKVHNKTNLMQPVTTKDIVVTNAEGLGYPLEVCERLFPKDPITGDHIIITKLKPNLFDPSRGEELHVRFRARKGIARDNACWCPVSMCSYKFIVDNAAAAGALTEKLAEVTDEKERDVITKSFNTLEIEKHYIRDANLDPTAYAFSIESECALTPHSLFTQAIKVLIRKLYTISHNEDNKVEIHPINEDTNFYAITIHDEDHTIGNLLQFYIHAKFVKANKEVTYVGYSVPHPLEREVIVKIKFSNVTDVNGFLKSTCGFLINHFELIKTEWHEAMSQTSAVPEPVAAPVAKPSRIIKRAIIKKK